MIDSTVKTKKLQNLEFTIIVNGRFHAFDYAAELQKRGMLKILISSMPRIKAKKFEIEKQNYIGLPVFEVLKLTVRKLFKRELPTMLYAKFFTKTALAITPDTSKIIIGFAGYCLEVFKSKKTENAFLILDRSSTHTLSNITLNEQAAVYHGMLPRKHAGNFVKRELEEYEVADLILVPTAFVKQTFIDNGVPEAKLLEIPYAMSTKKFDSVAKIKHPKSKAVLFVGQLSPRKGIKVLIDAMTVVRERFPDYELWLVGASNFKQISELLRCNWIKYKGILSGKDLFEVYSKASIFSLPSFEEGLAYVLTEANSFRLPIVATENSGANDAVSDKERLFLCLPGDAIDLSHKICDAIDYVDRCKVQFSDYEGFADDMMSWPMYCDKLIREVERRVNQKI